MWSSRFRASAYTVAGLVLLPSLAAGGHLPGVTGGESGQATAAARPVRAQDGPQSRAGFLGVEIQEVDREAVERLDLPREQGVLIESVVEGTPAEEAGLREDDVIVAWNGDAVAGTLELQRLVRETPPGRQVRMAFFRNGERREVRLTVGERPGPGARRGSLVFPGPPGRRDFRLYRFSPDRWEELADSISTLWEDSARTEELRERMRERAEEMRERLEVRPHAWRRIPGGGGALYTYHARRPARLGVQLQELTPQLAEYFGLDEPGGALVASVREDSPARDAGLRAGDVIVAIDGEPVEEPGDAAHVVRDKEGGPVEIRVVRDGRERTLTVELPARRESSLEPIPGEMLEGALPVPGSLPQEAPPLRIAPPPEVVDGPVPPTVDSPPPPTVAWST